MTQVNTCGGLSALKDKGIGEGVCVCERLVMPTGHGVQTISELKGLIKIEAV